MDRQLVERAMHGDEAAFDELVGRVGDRLHSVARRILRDPYLAEDATQRALLETWRSLPRLRDPDRFEAWAFRLLVHACRAEARRERHHRGNLRLLATDESVERPMPHRASRHNSSSTTRSAGLVSSTGPWSC